MLVTLSVKPNNKSKAIGLIKTSVMCFIKITDPINKERENKKM